MARSVRPQERRTDAEAVTSRRIRPQERRALMMNLKRISHLQKENLQLKLKQVPCAVTAASIRHIVTRRDAFPALRGGNSRPKPSSPSASVLG